uniref:Zinc finger protein n=1 Tax=Sipha flava TaxID=143950 RepID=A0A2S2R0S2_9HEMI
MFKTPYMEKSVDNNTTTTTTTTTTTLKSKKFPTMFKKMMLSRLKNISKDATSAVKSSVQKKKKSTAPMGTGEQEQQAAGEEPRRPAGAAASDEPPQPPPLQDGRTESGATGPRPPTCRRRPAAQQQQQHFNSRTYRVKTKDRKSVLSLPEVSKQTPRIRRSHLPVKVKPMAPTPPVRQRVQKPSPPVDSDRGGTDGEGKTPSADPAPGEYRPENWVPTAVASARKKRLVLCYLCGKEFGTASLPFHEPQCLKKWTLENSRLPEHLQRTLPQKPETQNISIDDWNQLAWEATQSNLVPCDYCQRKFLANRLEAHTRVCIESKKKIVPVRKPVPVVKPTMDGPKKKLATCYVCGRLFGTASVGIHEPQCLVKWTRENDGLPPHLRRPVPTRPEVIVDEGT